MNKFEKRLRASSKSIKAARAKMVAEDAQDAQEELIRVLKKERRDLQKNLLSLSDINRDSELSLKVVRDDFNAQSWVKELQKTKVSLANKDIELSIALSTFKEHFDEAAEGVGDSSDE